MLIVQMLVLTWFCLGLPAYIHTLEEWSLVQDLFTREGDGKDSEKSGHKREMISHQCDRPSEILQ